jgi:small subunit ribosomal protein S21
MLIIDVNESDSLERALKKYKKKFEKSGVLRQLRERKAYTKPSVKRRSEILRAQYIQQLSRESE